jgi:hypothetical protein
VEQTAYVCNSGGTQSFTVGGHVSGLTDGASLRLDEAFPGNSLTDSLTITAGGAFTFPTAVASGTTYNITVSALPNGEACFVTNGSSIVTNSNVTDVTVVCSSPVTLGGTISGLGNGDTVLLTDGAGDVLTIAMNGPFTFPGALAVDQPYVVSVPSQPTWGQCTIANGTGTMGTSNMTTVEVRCVETLFTVAEAATLSPPPPGCLVSFLAQQGQVTLSDGTDTITLPASQGDTVTPTQAFATRLPAGATYQLSASLQWYCYGQEPYTVNCVTRTDSSGTVSDSDVNAIADCGVNTFTVGGTVSGLTGAVTLRESVGHAEEELTITANGTFTLPIPVANQDTYSVTIQANPDGEVCYVSNPTGTPAGSDVTNIAVLCSEPITIGGTITGLGVGDHLDVVDTGPGFGTNFDPSGVPLDFNGSSLEVGANGTFVFDTGLAEGQPYSVVFSQPLWGHCSISNSSGTVGTSSVSDIQIDCVEEAFSIVSTATCNTPCPSLPGWSVADQQTSLTYSVASHTATVGCGQQVIAVAVPPGVSYSISAAGTVHCDYFADCSPLGVCTQSQDYPVSCTTNNGSGTMGSADASVRVTCQ